MPRRRFKPMAVLALLGWILAGIHCLCAGMQPPVLQTTAASCCCCGHADKSPAHPTRNPSNPPCPHCGAATVVATADQSVVVASTAAPFHFEIALLWGDLFEVSQICQSQVCINTSPDHADSSLLRLHCALII
ncbi:MAG: hypothetical protein M3O30_12805 [Planctomycetota bacterium]|nr:hypothetical protein [Planctomycetota bacterium]